MLGSQTKSQQDAESHGPETDLHFSEANSGSWQRCKVLLEHPVVCS